MSRVESSKRRNLAERLVQGPRGFRRLLERLGPTFIKLGQFLALRPDLIPQEYCDELMDLFDRVPPFPWPEAQAILETELGRLLPDVFARIDPEPLAAGSLAQTHYARLLDGSEVAVKIQRPGIAEKVNRDLRRARLLVRLLETSGVSFIIAPREVLMEVSAWMKQELDFSRELANLTRLYYLAAPDPNEKIPQPYPGLSTGKVLTAEYIRGVPFSEILARLGDRPSSVLRELQATGIVPEQLARNLLLSSLTQIFRYQFFHADVHPGNLMALPGSVIGFIDFGLCDELDATVRDRQMRYLYAAYTDNAQLMFRALTEILIASDDTDLEAFRRDFLDLTGAWQRHRDDQPSISPVTGRQGRSPTANWMIAVMQTARKHHLRAPPRILSLYRTLLTAESIANQLGADMDLQKVGRKFFEALQRDDILRSLRPEALLPGLVSLFYLVRDSPEQLERLLSQLSDGRFSLNTVTTESPRTQRIQNRRTRLIASAILSVGLALLLTRPEFPVVVGIGMEKLLVGALTLLYLLILVLLFRI
jgi:ubiquinone biosynthesis protein